MYKRYTEGYIDIYIKLSFIIYSVCIAHYINNKSNTVITIVFLTYMKYPLLHRRRFNSSVNVNILLGVRPILIFEKHVEARVVSLRLC